MPTRALGLRVVIYCLGQSFVLSSCSVGGDGDSECLVPVLFLQVNCYRTIKHLKLAPFAAEDNRNHERIVLVCMHIYAY